MKLHLFALAIALLSAPLISRSQKIEPVILENYFVKNTVAFPSDINCKVFKTTSSFDSYFGQAKTMNNTIVSPDFKNNWVIAVVQKTTYFKTVLHIDSTVVDGNKVNVYFSRTKGSKQSYSTVPFVAAVVPHIKNINAIHFYNGKKLNRKIAL